MKGGGRTASPDRNCGGPTRAQLKHILTYVAMKYSDTMLLFFYTPELVQAPGTSTIT